MHLIFRTALMLCTMLVFVAQALAADVRSYAVLPFKVNGSSGSPIWKRPSRPC